MITGFICYCPDLLIYHYSVKDDSKKPEEGGVEEYKFTNEELMATLEFHLSQNDEVKAEFVATMTGFGRMYPHQIVDFTTDEGGKVQVSGLRKVEPEPEET